MNVCIEYVSVNKNKQIQNVHKCIILVLGYGKIIGKRRAISYGSPEELEIIWQPQIKDSLKFHPNLFSLVVKLLQVMFTFMLTCLLRVLKHLL